MTSRTTRSVTTPSTSPAARRSRIRCEFDLGLSKPKRKTLESRNALRGILGLPHVLPELRGRDTAPRGRVDGRPKVLRAEQAQVRAVLHEGGSDRLRLSRAQ